MTALVTDESSIRVVVADDQPLVRGGICLLLSSSPSIEVVGQAGDGDHAVRLTRELSPDLVVMDLRMPGTDGIEATRLLTTDAPPGAQPDQLAKVLVLTTFNDDASVYGALRAGASGFLVKDSAPEQLVPAVHAVAHGNSWIDPAVAGQVLLALRSLALGPDRPGSPTSTLTPRERDVLMLMARGLTNREISRHYVLSEATVRTHVSRILMKTGSHDRTQAVVLAYQTGIVHQPR